MKTHLIETPYGKKTPELLCRAMDCLEDDAEFRANAKKRDADIAKLRAINAELVAALKYAGELVSVARAFFPKSIRNSDRFKLEQTCAAINNALAKAQSC